MGLKVEKTGLDGVLLIKPEVFEDFRGEYVETYNQRLYQEAGIGAVFVQDDVSVSRKNVLRGFHGDAKTTKLISCLLGEFYMVVVDCDKASPSFGKWVSFTLSERNRRQVLVPPMHGLAHLALSERIIFHYKQSTYYDPGSQFTYKWNHPEFGVWWPVKEPVLSRRDELGGFTG
ncbi:MAG: dTDP-4-dehydrorhamnose 3,5-epimerase family protein [Desulfovibrionaceae bacterium]|nr:dTDP-4-dehydrorhamnose 3,5-epimerase family protein [Desulfovibrionaceae bacterium]